MRGLKSLYFSYEQTKLFCMLSSLRPRVVPIYLFVEHILILNVKTMSKIKTVSKLSEASRSVADSESNFGGGMWILDGLCG